MNKQLINTLQEKEERMIEIRRYLHQHPELSFKEQETPKYIADFYKDKDCEVETNVGPNGVKVTIDSGKPGKTIAIRADFDALPIQEATGLPFASKNEGVMHACGHDAHTAYMLILGETLIEIKDQFKGKVIIIHQPAEEMPPGGAQLKVQGSGGHGSSPHMANDAIVAGAQFVTEVQTIVSRRLSPFETGVITIGSFDGKGQFNVIKDAVELEGDVRALTDDTRDTIEKELKRLVEGLESTFGVTCEFEFKKDYPALYNDPEFTQYVAQTIKEADADDIQGIEVCEPQPPSEDFYAATLPSTFFYSGAAPKDGKIYPHHHPKFTIDESSMLVAAEAVGTVVLDYLS